VVRELTEHDALEHRKDGDVGADASCQGCCYQQGETGPVPDLPQSVAKVMAQSGNCNA
jgi:hypothetical protein